VPCDALAGLEHAHGLCDERGAPLDLVHGDVRASRVVVTCRGEAKLVDFGTARAAAYLYATGPEEEWRGATALMAPEQVASGGLLRERGADVFAVGALLFRAIAGRGLYAPERARVRGAIEAHLRALPGAAGREFSWVYPLESYRVPAVAPPAPLVDAPAPPRRRPRRGVGAHPYRDGPRGPRPDAPPPVARRATPSAPTSAARHPGAAPRRAWRARAVAPLARGAAAVALAAWWLAR
jgi:serine/threonine protein kinase